LALILYFPYATNLVAVCGFTGRLSCKTIAVTIVVSKRDKQAKNTKTACSIVNKSGI